MARHAKCFIGRLACFELIMSTFRLISAQLACNQQQWVAACCGAERPAVVGPLRNLNDIGLNSHLEGAVLEMREGLQPLNTQKVQDSKIKECFQHCELVHLDDPHQCNLNREKMHHFMWHVAFRESEKQGGNREAISHGERFDLVACNQLMAGHQSSESNVAWPSPESPMGPATFGAFKAVVHKIHKVQKAARAISHNWDNIWTIDFDELQKHVKERAPTVKKANHVEKIDGVFAPCTIVECHSEIEQELWDDGKCGCQC